MTFRRLPRTIRDLLSSLKLQLGIPGLIVGLIALPFVLLAAIVSYPFVAVVRRVHASDRAGVRTLELAPDGLFFSWSGSREECREALADAVAALVEGLPGILRAPRIETLELLNPETGFALDPDRLRPITEDHASELARRLAGQKLEYGRLVVNGEIPLDGVDLEARSPISGHLGVDLPCPVPQALIARARDLGFVVRP